MPKPEVEIIDVDLERISCDGKPCPDPKLDLRAGRYGGLKVVRLPEFERHPAQAYRP